MKVHLVAMVLEDGQKPRYLGHQFEVNPAFAESLRTNTNLAQTGRDRECVGLALQDFQRSLDPNTDLGDYQGAIDDMVVFSMRKTIAELREELKLREIVNATVANQLFQRIKHGDQQHQDWLEAELKSFFLKRGLEEKKG